MIISKRNRIEVYKYLFKEGVLYAKKDPNLPKHPEIDVPNLHVLKLMQSFKSKEFVTENFAWRHHYYFLTNEGIEYLREYLSLPAEIVPATLKKAARPAAPAGGPGERDARRGGYGGDRDGYRGDRGDRKEGAAPGGYAPRFQGGGGYGRGAPPS
uniref:Plectin/eS10 N-terminal domain-containing protein n=1 Tax=Prasinoderma singulare TaxID=676789 RepID=A0A7S3FH85_9VIRI